MRPLTVPTLYHVCCTLSFATHSLANLYRLCKRTSVSQRSCIANVPPAGPATRVHGRCGGRGRLPHQYHRLLWAKDGHLLQAQAARAGRAAWVTWQPARRRCARRALGGAAPLMGGAPPSPGPTPPLLDLTRLI